MAREAADWRRGRSALRRGSSPRASRRAFCAALLRLEAGWTHEASPNLWTRVKPYRYPPCVGPKSLIPGWTSEGSLIVDAAIQSYPLTFEQAITTSWQPRS